MTEKNRLLEGIAASPGIVIGPARVLTQEGQVRPVCSTPTRK